MSGSLAFDFFFFLSFDFVERRNSLAIITKASARFGGRWESEESELCEVVSSSSPSSGGPGSPPPGTSRCFPFSGLTGGIGEVGGFGELGGIGGGGGGVRGLVGGGDGCGVSFKGSLDDPATLSPKVLRGVVVARTPRRKAEREMLVGRVAAARATQVVRVIVKKE